MTPQSNAHKKERCYEPCNDFKVINCSTCGRYTKHKMTRIYIAESDGKQHWEGWCTVCLNVNDTIVSGKVKTKYPRAPLPWLNGAPTL